MPAFEVSGQVVGACQGGQGGDLGGGVDGAGLGQVGQGQHAALDAVDAGVSDAGECRFKGLRRDLAMLARHRDHLGTGGEELRRAAFVGGGMGVDMGEDGGPRRGQQGDREGVGGGAGGDEVDLGLGRLKQLTDKGFYPAHDRVSAVAAGVALVCP
jgi:hypothetical protein